MTYTEQFQPSIQQRHVEVSHWHQDLTHVSLGVKHGAARTRNSFSEELRFLSLLLTSKKEVFSFSLSLFKNYFVTLL